METEVDTLGERIAEQAAHLDAATHRLLTDLRQFDAVGGWHIQGARTCAHWLAWRVGWDLVTARDRVRVARKLGEFPATDDALRRGELSYSKVRAILRVATPANEAMLLECARFSTASQLENLSRKYARVQAHDRDIRPQDDEQRRFVRRYDTEDGMVKIVAVLHSEEAELVWTMLDHAAKRLAREPDLVSPEAESRSASASSAPAARNMSLDPSAPVDAGAKEQSCVNADAGARALGEAGAPAETNGQSESGASGAVLESSSGNDSAESPRFAERVLVGGAAATTLASGSASAESSFRTPAAHVVACHATANGGPEVRLALTAAAATALPSQVGARSLPAHVDATRRAFSRADALMAVVQAYLRGDRPERAPVDVMVTIQATDLKQGADDPAAVGYMGASCIAAETARRLGCDAGVIEVVEDSNGVPMSVGRKRRTISGSLKRALLKRDRACTYPGCTNRLFLEGHHLRHWADGGETSLENACLLCSHHHRFVHEHGYCIELDAAGRPRFRDPGGRVVAPAPAVPSLPDLGWPAIHASNQGLDIDAETIACEWEGTPMPYGRIVDQLVAIDGLS